MSSIVTVLPARTRRLLFGFCVLVGLFGLGSVFGVRRRLPDFSADEPAIVAMVKSRSVITGLTPSGSLTAEMWIESPMSAPVRSTVMNSGIALAGQWNSTSWRTMLSTPPRLMPGDFSSLMKWTGTLTLTSVSLPMRRKSTCIGKSLTGSSW